LRAVRRVWGDPARHLSLEIVSARLSVCIPGRP